MSVSGDISVQNSVYRKLCNVVYLMFLIPQVITQIPEANYSRVIWKLIEKIFSKIIWTSCSSSNKQLHQERGLIPWKVLRYAKLHAIYNISRDMANIVKKLFVSYRYNKVEGNPIYVHEKQYFDSERSDDCIDFIMMCFFVISCRNNASILNFGGSFQWQSEHPCCITEVKSKNFPTVFKKMATTDIFDFLKRIKFKFLQYMSKLRTFIKFHHQLENIS
ncbi:hypothetical protein AGLY_000734 [Aphis glycines]|uniref:Uncharacterized protein n=1 Tax=Aphis glycines TaxID=307491 RepID=A0A6G0U7U1_APHGL|nr:hypothetical protein AGLY_000734 [Aphis glycines]